MAVTNQCLTASESQPKLSLVPDLSFYHLQTYLIDNEPFYFYPGNSSNYYYRADTRDQRDLKQASFSYSEKLGSSFNELGVPKRFYRTIEIPIEKKDMGDKDFFNPKAIYPGHKAVGNDHHNSFYHINKLYGFRITLTPKAILAFKKSAPEFFKIAEQAFLSGAKNILITHAIYATHEKLAHFDLPTKTLVIPPRAYLHGVTFKTWPQEVHEVLYQNKIWITAPAFTIPYYYAYGKRSSDESSSSIMGMDLSSANMGDYSPLKSIGKIQGDRVTLHLNPGTIQHNLQALQNEVRLFINDPSQSQQRNNYLFIKATQQLQKLTHHLLEFSVFASEIETLLTTNKPLTSAYEKIEALFKEHHQNQEMTTQSLDPRWIPFLNQFPEAQDLLIEYFLMESAFDQSVKTVSYMNSKQEFVDLLQLKNTRIVYNKNITLKPYYEKDYKRYGIVIGAKENNRFKVYYYSKDFKSIKDVREFLKSTKNKNKVIRTMLLEWNLKNVLTQHFLLPSLLSIELAGQLFQQFEVQPPPHTTFANRRIGDEYQLQFMKDVHDTITPLLKVLATFYPSNQ